MEKYIHKVQYYETDKMGITHHSNYVRWMEEARVDYLEKIGFGFDRLEAAGVVSPIVSVSCSYKKPTRFPELVTIKTRLKEAKGVRLKLAYEMYNEADELVFEGITELAMLDINGMPFRMKKLLPEFYDKMQELAED